MRSNILIISLLSLFLVTGCRFKKKAEPEVKTQAEITRDLFSFIYDGDVDQVKAVIDSGADVNAYDGEGYTPLMRAVQVEHVVIIETLIKSGAKLFKTQKGDFSNDAYAISLRAGDKVKAVIDRELIRLGREIETRLENHQYLEVQNYIEENYILYDLLLPNSEKTVIMHLAVNSIKSKEAIELALHEIKRHPAQEILENDLYLNLLKMASKQESTDLLGSVINKLKGSYSDDIRLAQFYEEDKSLSWITRKFDFLVKVREPIDTVSLSKSLKSYLVDLKNNLNDLENIKQIIDTFFIEARFFKNDEDALFYDFIFDSLANEAKESSEVFNLFQHMIYLSTQQDISGQKYDYDQILLKVLEVDSSIKIEPFSRIEKIIELVSKISPYNRYNSSDAIKFLLSNYDQNEK